MRLVQTLALCALFSPLASASLAAQGLGTPSRLAEVELERSRSCVPLLSRVEELNARMEPFARRGQRLQAIAQAVALEERSVIDSLKVDDPVEAKVRDWFSTDAALARRYVAQQNPSIQAERTAGRETIKATLSKAIQDVQAEANAIVAENQELIASASQCDGAIFVRPAVLEACEQGSGPLCEEAQLPASEVTRFRFVDTPESIWEIEELRPWTTPNPLRRGPTGQIDGARTIGFTRVGNVIVSVAFTPLIAPRDRTPPEVLAAYEATNDTLGLSVDHPDLVFTPALGVRVSLPNALGEEDGYILHFGTPEEADVVWAGKANTGSALQATVPLTPSQTRRLTAGDQLMLTAIDEGGEVPDAIFAVAVGTVNQAQMTQGLLRYMGSQLSQDLTKLVPPAGTRSEASPGER